MDTTSLSKTVNAIKGSPPMVTADRQIPSAVLDTKGSTEGQGYTRRPSRLVGNPEGVKAFDLIAREPR